MTNYRDRISTLDSEEHHDTTSPEADDVLERFAMLYKNIIEENKSKEKLKEDMNDLISRRVKLNPYEIVWIAQTIMEFDQVERQFASACITNLLIRLYQNDWYDFTLKKYIHGNNEQEPTGPSRDDWPAEE